MEITEVFDRLWYVHADGKFAGKFTTRKEARARRAALTTAKSVTISYSQVTVGPITASH